MHRLLSSVGSVLLFLSAACMMPKADLWIEEGSTATHLRFGYGAERGSSDSVRHLESIRVTACRANPADAVFWQAGDFGDRGARAGQFAYGEPPAGLRTRSGPRPLGPGCYSASLHGNDTAAEVCFEVRPDGQVVPLPYRSTRFCTPREGAI